MKSKSRKMPLSINIFVSFQSDCSLEVGKPRGSRLSEQSCWQSRVNKWSSDCTSEHLFASVFASLRILWLSIRLSCCGWPCTASIHIHTYIHTNTHTHPHTHTHKDPRGCAERSTKTSFSSCRSKCICSANYSPIYT